MLDLMRFIFSSFWVWLGTVILLTICISPVIFLFDACTSALSTLRVIFASRRRPLTSDLEN